MAKLRDEVQGTQNADQRGQDDLENVDVVWQLRIDDVAGVRLFVDDQ